MLLLLWWVFALPDSAAIREMRALAAPLPGDRAVVAGESAVAGLAALANALTDANATDVLGLGADSRVLLFVTEGATDPTLYREIIEGVDP